MAYVAGALPRLGDGGLPAPPRPNVSQRRRLGFVTTSGGTVGVGLGAVGGGGGAVGFGAVGLGAVGVGAVGLGAVELGGASFGGADEATGGAPASSAGWGSSGGCFTPEAGRVAGFQPSVE